MRTKEQRDKLHDMDNAKLREELVDTKKELFNLRFMLATGASTDHAQINLAKKKVARIHTILRQKELVQASSAK